MKAQFCFYVVIAKDGNKEEAYRVELYPNPAESILSIELDTFFDDEAILEVINSKGNTVIIDKLSISAGIATIDMSGWMKGVYIIKPFDNDIHRTVRIVTIK
jgi:hypothetical protein